MSPTKVSASPLLISATLLKLLFVSYLCLQLFWSSCSIAISQSPSLLGIWNIDVMLRYLPFMCMEECRHVHNSKARTWHSRSVESTVDQYLAIWMESEYATCWPAAFPPTKGIFHTYWTVIFINSYKIWPHALKSIIIDPLNRRKAGILYTKRGLC